MWKLNKTNLGKATNEDITRLGEAAHLSASTKLSLKELYKNYDAQGGNVTADQISSILSDEADRIKAAYEKTYEGHPLSYIRSELINDIYRCPYCSLSQPTTLDHYMPKSQYKALAVCRMNLIPMCSTCNSYKSTKSHSNFIHCYYEYFPTSIFLIAKVSVSSNRFVVKFDFDSQAIGNTQLERKLRYQADEIRLFKRLEKESTVFISTLCNECEVNDTDSLKIWLSKRVSNIERRYGKNDWRSALLRGILAYSGLDISIINANRDMTPLTNAGGI